MNRLPWLLSARLEQYLFYLLLLLLPVNLAKHFFFSFVYVKGVLVDYLIPTLYLTDILLLLLLFLWLLRYVGGNTHGISAVGKVEIFPPLLFVLFLMLVSAVSLWGAQNQPAAVYRWLKLLEYLLFFVYVARNVSSRLLVLTAFKLLAVGVFLESVLTILQWFNQGSLFGFWFLGENQYNVATPGIALLEFATVKKVRPYGTFPHPNVLGGYLALILPWLLYLILKGAGGAREKKFYALTLLLALLALYLSFSRSAWLVGGLGLISLLVLMMKRHSMLTSNLAFFALNSLSLIRRAELNWIALQMIRAHPLWGVGLNNFTVRMDEYGRVSGWTRFLQPVHNIYLLIAAEVGLPGLLVFLGLLLAAFRLLLKNKNYLFLISLLQLLLLGLADHYFWTIQQSALLFWFTLGLTFSVEVSGRKIETKR